MTKRVFGYTLFLFVLSLNSSIVYAQDISYIEDSLTTLIQNEKNDSSRVDRMITLARFYYRFDLEKADSLARRTLIYAKQINYSIGQEEAYTRIGLITRKMDNYDDAYKYLDSSLKIAKKIKDSAGISIVYNNIGVLKEEQGHTEQALENYLKSLDIDRSLGDSVGISYSLNNIGLIYGNNKNTNKAIEYLTEAIEVKQKLGNKESSAYSFINLGNMYRIDKNHSEALLNYEKALKIYQEFNNKQGIAKAYNNLGLTYVEMGNYNKAEENLLKALDIRLELGAKSDIIRSQNALGELYKEQGNYRKAVQILQISEKNALELQLTGSLLSIYSNLKGAYIGLNDYENAYKYADKLTSIKDSILSAENAARLNELQIQYEVKQNEEEKLIAEADNAKSQEALAQTQLEKEKTSFRLIVVSIILVFALVLIILFYRNSKILKKLNNTLKEKNVIIEKNNRNITDSINYAKRIQDTMLPNTEQFESFFKSHFLFYTPKDIVSGDFYWVTQNENQLFLVVADSTGHGVPGAMVSMLNMSLLNQYARLSKNYTTESILKRINISLNKRLNTNKDYKNKDGMDLSLIKFTRLENGKTEMEFAAAMSRGIIIRGTEYQHIIGDRESIGGFSGRDADFTSQKFDLNKGDRIILFTDGIIDQFGGPKNKKFKLSGITKLLDTELPNTPTLSELGNKIQNAFEDWIKSTPQTDDITFLIIEV